jgi:hypothetical protein
MYGNYENKTKHNYEKSWLHSPVVNIMKLLIITLSTARELFLLLVSTQSDLTPPGDSLQGTAEDKVTVCRCNTNTELRAAVTAASHF